MVLSKAKFAGFCGYSSRQVGKWIDEGLPVQAEKMETENRLRNGELLELDDLEALIIEGAAIFTGQKRSMGSRLAGQLAGMNDPTKILKLLNAENDWILKGVADKFSSLAARADQGNS